MKPQRLENAKNESEFFSITKLHTPHDKGCQSIQRLVTGPIELRVSGLLRSENIGLGTEVYRNRKEQNLLSPQSSALITYLLTLTPDVRNL